MFNSCADSSARLSLAGLVLVLPSNGYEHRLAESERYVLDAELVDRHGVEAFIDRVNATGPPEIVESVAPGFRFVPDVKEAVLPAVLRGAAASDLPSRELVESIAAPTLVLTWDGDDSHPLAVAEELAALIKGADLAVARDLREVGDWTNRVKNFLAAIRP